MQRKGRQSLVANEDMHGAQDLIQRDGRNDARLHIGGGLDPSPWPRGTVT